MNQEIVRRPRKRRPSDTSPEADWATLAANRRYRFVQPLCQGRSVIDLGPASAGQSLIAGVAVSPDLGSVGVGSSGVRLDTADAAELGRAEVVLHLQPIEPAALPDLLPALRQQLADDGVLAVAITGTADPSAIQTARNVLAGAFAHLACFRERPIAGSMILDERFAQSRVVPLHDAAQPGDIALFICSSRRLPPLAGGLFEEQAASIRLAGTPGAEATIPLSTPGFDGPALGAFMSDIADVMGDQATDPPVVELRDRAVGLVERLLMVEDRIVDLQLENRRLRAEKSAIGGSDSRYTDFPQIRHDWPLAERPDLTPDALEPYDRRVDDPVIIEGRQGELFFSRFGLLGETPDFTAAIAALNGHQRRLRLVAPSEATQPDASIVIPVWGQLSYTLNCLDSLFDHRSKYTAEIIVVDDVSPDTSGDWLPLVEGIRYHRQPVNGGFIQSCTTGAEMATGRYIIMLNNDTRVVEGWLDELLDTFQTFPKAGAVGSKLFYPDGVLQEAGGIIWRDGSAWNVGRNDEPNRPQYSYARQVDYVSGCSLALPMDLWRSLGGFDPYFKPAYCEDGDLCLKVVDAGHEMWMQPQSRIVHYEGKTSGTDLKVGVKAYQVINQKRLFLRWRERLTAHRLNGDTPMLERERSVRRRVLVIDATTPTPKQDAGSVTTTLTLSLLHDAGYKASFVPQDNFLFQPTYTTDLQRLGIDCAYAPYDVDFEAYMRRNGPLFDVVLVFRVTVLEKVIDTIRKYAPQAPILFNNMDLHFLRMEREAHLSGDQAALDEAAAMKVRECDLMSRVDCTITPSTFEKEVLAQELPDAPVIVWPFMFEFFGTEAGFDERRDFIFLGGYRHTPNVDAVKFFVHDVLPLIQAEEPDARFIIAGANPTDEVLALAGPSVVVTGLVDDLRDVFDTSRVLACPLRVGAGVKGKVSTAMSYGLPVVSTTCGAEGMDLIDGEELLIADDPADFAQACLRLYRDRDLWERFSKAGMVRVQEKHSLAVGRKVLEEAVEIGYSHLLGLVP